MPVLWRLLRVVSCAAKPRASRLQGVVGHSPRPRPLFWALRTSITPRRHSRPLSNGASVGWDVPSLRAMTEPSLRLGPFVPSLGSRPIGPLSASRAPSASLGCVSSGLSRAPHGLHPVILRRRLSQPPTGNRRIRVPWLRDQPRLAPADPWRGPGSPKHEFVHWSGPGITWASRAIPGRPISQRAPVDNRTACVRRRCRTRLDLRCSAGLTPHPSYRKRLAGRAGRSRGRQSLWPRRAVPLRGRGRVGAC